MTKIFEPLKNNIAKITQDFDKIPAERKELIKKLSLYVEKKIKENQAIQLVFICTHNSRRSHISQVWAQVAAAYYGIEGVKTFSGGTEATAFNPRAVKAMEKLGFYIEKGEGDPNPQYKVSFSETDSLTAFSKKYDDAPNPSENFAAIMTCGHADENCPFIPGASARIPLTYDDPKDFDGTPLEEAKYDERAREIGTEILYAFSIVKK
jgi:arsenate reductase (thioredoxin)